MKRWMIATLCMLTLAVGPLDAAQRLRNFDIHYDTRLVTASVQPRGKPSSTLDVSSGTITDQYVRLVVAPKSNVIEFALTNLGTSTEKILWEDAAFVDVAGLSHRAIHRGVRLQEANQAMPAASVPIGAHVEDFVASRDSVAYVSGHQVGGVRLPPVPYIAAFGPDEIRALDAGAAEHQATDAVVGKKVTALIPLETIDGVFEYSLTVEIISAHAH